VSEKSALGLNLSSAWDKQPINHPVRKAYWRDFGNTPCMTNKQKPRPSSKRRKRRRPVVSKGEG